MTFLFWGITPEVLEMYKKAEKIPKLEACLICGKKVDKDNLYIVVEDIPAILHSKCADEKVK